MQLSAELQKQIRRALLTAFPLYGQLDVVVADADMKDGDAPVLFVRFNTPGLLLDSAVNNLLVWVASNDYVVQFVTAAYNKAPRNPQMKAVKAALDALNEKYQGLRPDEDEFPLDKAERLIFAGFTFEDVAVWLDDIGKKRRAVCRVEPQPMTLDPSSLHGYGTGFLVAPDIVMTNDHVAARFYDKPEAAAKVVCRFDFEAGAGGTAAGTGTPHRLHPTAWRVIRSAETDLDFALLKLSTRAGDDMVGGAERGFLTPTSYNFTPDEPLVILQHPLAAPLKLALGPVTAKPWAMNRVAYKVNTEGGSSGSPCFTQQRELAAIHHLGATKQNQGVLQSAILSFLKGLKAEDKKRLTDIGLAHLVD